MPNQSWLGQIHTRYKYQQRFLLCIGLEQVNDAEVIETVPVGYKKHLCRWLFRLAHGLRNKPKCPDIWYNGMGLWNYVLVYPAAEIIVFFSQKCTHIVYTGGRLYYTPCICAIFGSSMFHSTHILHIYIYLCVCVCIHVCMRALVAVFELGKPWFQGHFRHPLLLSVC